MPTAAEIVSRYRVAGLAVVISAAVHAAVFVGLPLHIEPFDEGNPVAYSASLDPAAATVTQAPAARLRRAASSKPRSRLAPPPIAQAALEPLPALLPEPEIAALAPDLTQPKADAAAEATAQAGADVVALAQPTADAAAAAPAKTAAESFPVEALPANLSISYQLTSSWADGRAEYTWSRDGDNYTIKGEAEAVGFFTLFLEGRILQESRGTVTATGLRPQRFVERKPNSALEGLEFDWPAGQVTMDRGDLKKKTTPLTDNTVDWLSMIFQMAHKPPTGDAMELRVFTQRKLYRFQLKILGEEEIQIPLGKVRALHLRHIDPDDETEIVDVWLGIDQYHLPVKLRYPVARNRLVVEQIATKVTSP
ncbi:MAG: DUF3108 domain-containing protein [Usitatibacter sp.]